MNLTDTLLFEPDEELRQFLEEYDKTNGRMYQGSSKLETAYIGSPLSPIRPRYYGREASNNLRQFRNTTLMSQVQLAARTGTTRRTISNIENLKHEPSVYLALAIAEALEVKVEDIFHLPLLTPVPPSKY